MAYPSVDELQKFLSRSVFDYAADKKKAAGRALGTLVEVITFYLLKSWELERFVAIERPLPEYLNDEITHNVEYSLHPSTAIATLNFSVRDLPISVSKILRALKEKGIGLTAGQRRTQQLLSADLVLRNACTLGDENDTFLVATLSGFAGEAIQVVVNRLFRGPFAIAECKRVGLEEGTRKGPQTIEKAKQGAYVARSVSSLQKVRLRTGDIGGVFARADGGLVCKRYDDFIREVIEGSNAEYLRDFILTVGVVSNHGNWFTTDDHNKELKVLAQSYDWLVFLTDLGLAEFLNDLILKPSSVFQPVRDAFLASYKGESGVNRFTKVQMTYAAGRLLDRYFTQNLTKVESWFNVIAPRGQTLNVLRAELEALAAKNWGEIRK